MQPLVLVLFVIANLFIYLLPTTIAVCREHPNGAPIFIVNFFLGWTLVGWVIALAWSVSHLEAKQGSAAHLPRVRRAVLTRQESAWLDRLE